MITGGQRGGNGLNMKVAGDGIRLYFRSPLTIPVRVQGVKGRGTKHVVHWKLGDNQLKVNLIVYDSDVMQVETVTCIHYLTTFDTSYNTS